MHCRDPALPSPVHDGLSGPHALQRRANELHRKLQEKPRLVVSVDLCHKLRRAAVELHEDGLLGQWRSKVLRPSEAVAAKAELCAHIVGIRRASALHRPMVFTNC
jgi:hypothetical protein